MKKIQIHILDSDEGAKEYFKDDPRVVIHESCENPTCRATFNKCKHSKEELPTNPLSQESKMI